MDFKKSMIVAVLFALMFCSACSLRIRSSKVDQLYTKSEKNVTGTVFCAGDKFVLCVEGENVWKLVESDASETLKNEMDDFDFAKIDADITWLDGGVAGFMHVPQIDKVNSLVPITFEECDKNEILATYDPDEEYFSGPHIYRDGNDIYVVIYLRYKDYRVYKNGSFIGEYETALEVKGTLGVAEYDETAQYESIHNVPLYVFCMDGVYLGYGRYMGLNQWAPILDKNFENALATVTLNDGELLYIEDADIEIINGGEKGYSNTVLIEKFTKSEIIGYDILNKDHWEEGLAKEDYACAEYDCGRYMIFYLDGQYHVYHDDMTVDEEDHFIGVFNSEEQVDEAMGRQ